MDVQYIKKSIFPAVTLKGLNILMEVDKGGVFFKNHPPEEMESFNHLWSILSLKILIGKILKI